ncbi:MAG: SUMF1/EgtB/PvdO family nonheme iron enzyme [Fibrobacter sp.]|nr:SUMF1/EgtB/PvdO family nonheme iron enzyme [Fibrobacter sp.]
MKKIILLVFFIICACKDKAPTELTIEEVVETSYPLIHLKSAKQKVNLSEHSVVQLSQDFWLAPQEVSQGQFAEIMGYLPAIRSALRGDSLPVVNISAVEAMLFCNALSKIDNLDTVYSYAHIEKEGDKIKSVLALKSDLSVQGYRLPTEAEWIFAAQDLELRPQNGWVAENSQGILHLPCSYENPTEVCDLIGNAMEMVEGWYQEPPAGTHLDYVGALNPNDMEERMVKGGSVLHEVSAAHGFNRRDVYSANLLSAQEYIGFRVARGSIDKPLYAVADAITDIASSQIDILATKEKIKSFFGTAHLRLVLVNSPQQTIYTLNYSAPSPKWTARPAGELNPRHPSISPDGRYIAFGTRGEGQAGESTLWGIAFGDSYKDPMPYGFGAIPRWWENDADTVLYYVSSAASNNDSLAWLRGKTSKRQLKDGFAQEKEDILVQGAYHSGMDSAQKWLVTASTQLRVLNMETGELKTLFQFPQNGKDSTGSTQVCNASISPGANPRIAFLDFGYTKKSSLVGRAYGVHEFIFIMDPATGEVTDTIAAPTGAVAWDDPEWSNHPDFIIATATDKDGYRKDLYAINVRTHKKLHLAHSYDLQTPMLWIRPQGENTADFSDSLALYAFPYTPFTLSLANQLERFWLKASEIDGIVMGSSRCYHGIIPEDLSTGIYQNLCLQGGVLPTVKKLLPYLFNHATKVNTMVLSLDLDLMFFSTEQNWEDRFGKSIGYLYDSLNNFWAEGLPEGFLEEVVYKQSPTIHETSSNWGGATITGIDSYEYSPEPSYTINNPNLDYNMQLLAEIISQAKEKKMQVLGVATPQNNFEARYYGRYGLSIADAEDIKKRILELQAHNQETFKVLDLHQNGAHKMPVEGFFDMDHVNIEGSQWITTRVDSVLREGW